MLELKDLSFSITKEGEPHHLVDDVSIEIGSNHFMAIVGPSGCGKTTLLRTIAGLNEESNGSIVWDGRDLAEEGDFEPQELGYVPQFSIAYDELTVDEAIESALRLRVHTRSSDELNDRIDQVLEVTGLSALSDRLVKVLSGGQKRRLGLAMELVSNPRLLLCDEVTSGLDPRSERDIVRLLHSLSRQDDRVIISVTHSLAHLDLYDSILVLHEGKVAYHGPTDQLTHYFSVNDTEEIYPRLGAQTSEASKKSWYKHRTKYYNSLENNNSEKIKAKKEANQSEEPNTIELPGVFSQFLTLLSRRFKIFSRDKGQILLQVAVLVLFPLMVTVFAYQANEAPLKFPQPEDIMTIEQGAQIPKIAEQRGKLGSSLGGIVMFQIVLLSLMGSNNSAREIAGERSIWEKEKFGGVRPLSYLLSKIVFLSILVLIQSVTMSLWVNQFWQFPGYSELSFIQHTFLLVMVNSAITFICLGVSSMMKTAEQASLLSIYIVGFQLPLSGAILSLPHWLEIFTQPLISAYWSWSGSITSMKDSHRQTIISVIDTDFSPFIQCIAMLSIHILFGLIIALIGIRKHRWQY